MTAERLLLGTRQVASFVARGFLRFDAAPHRIQERLVIGPIQLVKDPVDLAKLKL